VIHYVAQRVVAATPAAVWAVVSDPDRFPGWFEGVETVESEGPPGRRQTHAVEGPWGDQRFRIERVAEQWQPELFVQWRDIDERLDGVRPAEQWHAGSWLAVALERDTGGTRVTLEGTQLPASEAWRGRLTASVPMIEARLAASLERLADLLEPK
jgi:uncharacterized protein YndB with AHSA1/START domain